MRLKIFNEEDIARFEKMEAERPDFFERMRRKHERERLFRRGEKIPDDLQDHPGLPYPDFHINLKPEIDRYLALSDIMEHKWEENYVTQWKCIYKALYDYNAENIPPWKPYSPLECLAYFLAFHVYEELRTHPVVVDILKLGWVIPDYKEYATPFFFWNALDYSPYPWDKINRIMIDSALPYINRWTEKQVVMHRNHGRIHRAIFMGDELMYEGTEAMHDSLRRTLPMDSLEPLMNDFHIELTTGKARPSGLHFKRFLDRDWTLTSKDRIPYLTEYFKWIDGKRDTPPDYNAYKNKRGAPVDNDDNE